MRRVLAMLLSFAMKSGLSEPAMLTFEFHDALLYGAKYRHIFFSRFFSLLQQRVTGFFEISGFFVLRKLAGGKVVFLLEFLHLGEGDIDVFGAPISMFSIFFFTFFLGGEGGCLFLPSNLKCLTTGSRL
uniref:Putative secreted protein n=1 Tax=Ixodes ricinus TaxID=34613 RepID=A0A6B0UR60_IXORI